jgi:hypothetical protein
MPRRLALAGLVALLAAAAAAVAADRGKLAAFIEVTGYGVVIESLQEGAMSGPGLVGDAPDTFGKQYASLAEEVFDPAQMQARALDILAAVMPDELVDAGADFYASDLGQRLVAAENEGHMTPAETKYQTGSQLVEAMLAASDPRIELFRSLNDAVGSQEVSIRAVVEIQVRFLLAAAAAGVLPQGPEEGELRAMLTAQAEANAAQNEIYGLIANAYTYRDVSTADLEAYLEALRTPRMQQVYEVLNATQFQVMIERYEMLGARLGELTPQQDL